MTIEIFDANNVLRRDLEQFGTLSKERETLLACKPNHVWVWDGYNHNARRRQLFDGYKRRDPVHGDVYAWLDMMKELLAYSCVTQIEVPEWEADDVIGTIARRWIAEGIPVQIHTNDLDYFQIEGARLDGVNNKTGAPAKYIPLYKAMVGDSSDKIPGIPGFGPRAFIKLGAHWDHIIACLNNEDWYSWVYDAPITPGCKAWLLDPHNSRAFQSYWRIVHLWDVPLDLIDKHTYPGINDRRKSEALLEKYFL